MNIQIKNRYTNAVIHEGDYISIMEAVAGAVKTRANLYEADLYEADLTGANLTEANLTRANLTRANLTLANLTRANLTGADLTRANLYGADLYRADLYGADLYGADLTRANLYGANLYGADLYEADLTGANLTEANLTGANLTGANLTGAKNADLVIARTRILPEGDLIGWKKLSGGLIAKLIIQSKAKRSHAFGRKCRTSQAKVLAIYDGKKQVKIGVSQHDSSFEYRVGRIVKPKEPFSDKWTDECASGIHFYITRIEAENH